MYAYYIGIAFFVMIISQYSRNQILNKFFYTDTLTPQSAKQFREIGVTDLIMVKLLLYRGILKAAGNNRYYLDLDRKYEIEKNKEKFLIALVILASIFLIIAAAVTLFS